MVVTACCVVVHAAVAIAGATAAIASVRQLVDRSTTYDVDGVVAR